MKMLRIGPILILIVLSSCSQEDLNVDAYVQFLNNSDNNIYQEIKVNDLTYGMQYQPPEYLTLKELNIAEKNSSKWNNLLKQNSSHEQYHLTISKKGHGNPLYKKVSEGNEQDFDSKVEYYAFHMKDDIKLVVSNDTLTPLFTHLERTYNMLPHMKVILSFDGKYDKQLPRQIIFHDRELSDETIRWVYDSEVLNNIPKLN